MTSSIARRTVLASGLALAACREPIPTLPADTRRPITDAHLHLFNASDLPISGFIKNVYIPEHLPGWPRWADALIDLFTSLYKPLAITAEAELAGIGRRTSQDDADPAGFGRRSAAFIRERSEGRAADDALADSYRALTAELRQSTDARETQAAAPLSAALEAAAEDADAGRDPAAGPRVALDAAAASLRRLIGWGYLMTQSRARHLRDYRAKFGSADARPQTVFSLLVDYDLWLDDRPAARSDHLAQIAVQRALGSASGHPEKLRLFAGYCPLKHAIDRRRGGPTHFDRLMNLRRAGQITGFKIYPPMGFQPSGNTALADSAFKPYNSRGGLAQWGEAGMGPLGRALDDALQAFYRACVAARAPIVAHAGPGNGAGPSFGLRADPRLWEPVVRAHRVRLSLGHLVNDAEPFIAAVEGKPPYRGDVWALHGSLRMLNRRSPDAPDVYGDLAYMPELTADPLLARNFFRALREAFGPGDPDLSRILFGSDWIMTGLEPGNRRFLEAVETGMGDAGYTPTQRANILIENAQRFVNG